MTSPIQDYCLIPLTQGQFAKVSPHRFEELNQWKWHARWCEHTQSFYAVRSEWIDGRTVKVRMHRVILGLDRSDKRQGDHENHDTLDNRDDNLRVSTHQQNQHNRQKRKDNTTGFKGVAMDSGEKYGRRSAYVVFISHHGKSVYLGRFPATPDGLTDAAKKYDEAARERFGEFAHLNFPTRPPGL